MSYFRHPHKAKLRIAGRALMWILQRIQSAGRCSSFPAFDTREYPQSMASVGTLPPNTHVYLGDVKSMYTNIPHPRLYEVVDWVLARAAELCPKAVPRGLPTRGCRRPHSHALATQRGAEVGHRPHLFHPRGPHTAANRGGADGLTVQPSTPGRAMHA